MLERIEDLRAALEEARGAGRTVGVVPTMGALHGGHASLIRRAASECGLVAVTVFVNPLQFGPHDDLNEYPRDLDADRRVAADAGAELIFAPTVAEMYPAEMATSVTVAGLSDRLEGASRPGHFTGVATVVAKLLATAGACRAYFGEKDFQQLVVVRRLVADLSLPAEVVGCPTVRHADGLALSSRNAYLGPAERRAATVLYRALQAGAAMVAEGARRPEAVGRRMAECIAAEPLAACDYAEAVAEHDLGPLPLLAGGVRLLVAARIGRARLIDNLGLEV